MLNSIDIKTCRHLNIIPVELNDGIIKVISSEENYTQQLAQQIFALTGKKVEIVQTSHQQFQQLSFKYLGQTQSNTISTKRKAFNYKVQQAEYLDELIKSAIHQKISDIHIEPLEHKARIRFRKDGKLLEKFELNKQDYQTLVNKIKIVSGIDIAEKRLPQDGRSEVKLNNQTADLRISTLPTQFGEKAVIRILNKEAQLFDLNNLGLTSEQVETLKNALRKQHGKIIISGPTGSGKTTTLYACLNFINGSALNILTIEDPIEYRLKGINQVQCNESIGLNFSKALKTFLRQDPDVIMLGEIRDTESAQISLRAALTGHLVLSTIHTNSAIGIIDRLENMGIPAYLLPDTIQLLMAQRLIRLLCEHCKEETKAPNPKIEEQLKTNKIYKAKGCEHCDYTGYQGRVAIFELIEMNHEVRNYILNPSARINSKSFQILHQNALTLCSCGKTSLEEVYPYII